MRWLAAAFIALVVLLVACHGKDSRKVVVLGIDGMDPELLRGLIEAGRMPNFSALAAEGGFVKLGTSMPPQSPVAWSNMITGMDPGGHGVFDFVHRDPVTRAPKSSAADTDPIGFSLSLGRYTLPLSGGESHNTRKGEAFWQVLDEHGIRSAVYRMPSNFPPAETSATTFSGMGTPDLMMGYGTYQIYTDTPLNERLDGGIAHLVNFRDEFATSVLTGPTNSFLKEPKAATIPIAIYRDRESMLIKVELGGTATLLKEGEWSDWLPVSFEMIPHLASAQGVCRLYLKRCQPDLKLYVSPINIDPLAPATPISTPDAACEDLALAIGRYYTKGMPEETKALQDGVFDDEDFARQGRLVMDESKKMLDHALAQFDSGLLFFYFSSIDLNCHMLWRHRDPTHPAHDPALAKRYASRIEDLYVEMDQIVGDVRRKLPPDATLIIMSDHGFASFRREMNLNTWLERHGYLVLEEGTKEPDAAKVYESADWSKTRAYSIGFNGIYLNVAGREQGGIVSETERKALAEQIRNELLEEKDPKTGERFISSINLATEIYHGDYVGEAPDLLVGFARGYGASDSSCLGELSKNVLDDHNSAWSGNHLMAADQVPGILLTNKKIAKRDPVLQDITVTILKLFGIDKLPKMTGQSVLEPST